MSVIEAISRPVGEICEGCGRWPGPLCSVCICRCCLASPRFAHASDRCWPCLAFCGTSRGPGPFPVIGMANGCRLALAGVVTPVRTAVAA